MKKVILATTAVLTASLTLGLAASPVMASDAEAIFNKKCKMCHSIDKKKMGPAVKTMNSDAETLRSAITDGRKRMPAFGKKLSAEEIEGLVVFIQAQKG